MSHPEDEDEYAGLRSQTRVRAVAWVVIIALVVTGGGAAAYALLFG